MSKPFDATLKRLLEESPSDWPVLAGLPRTPVEVIDTDISVVLLTPAANSSNLTGIYERGFTG